MSGSDALLVSLAGEELTVALEPLCLSKKDLVLLAVNNSSSVTSAGGSHWYVVMVETCGLVSAVGLLL